MSKVLIVDGYSGGSHIISELKKQNLEVYHLQTAAPIWSLVAPKFDYGQYADNLLEAEYSFKTLAGKLQAYSFSYIVPGTETGVELADRLSFELGLPSNGIKFSSARRDKFEMIKACAEYGLLVPSSFKNSNVLEIEKWYLDSKLSKAVIKPLRSAGTDGVYFCHNLSDVLNAANSLLQTTNKLGALNDEVLISEFMQGDEYFIDTISSNGIVHITDIWRYEKRKINNHEAVYDRNILCDPNGEIEKKISDYAKKVLLALEINYGPAHIEIMMTKKGPMLVEIGARLDGLTNPGLNQAAIGFSPVELIHDAYSNNLLSESSYSLKKFTQTVYLTSYESGVLSKFVGLDFLKSLESFYEMTMRLKEGEVISKTTNYFTAPGVVVLMSEDPQVIERDYKRIRELEVQNEIFNIG
jgi:hypothetical protein